MTEQRDRAVVDYTKIVEERRLINSIFESADVALAEVDFIKMRNVFLEIAESTRHLKSQQSGRTAEIIPFPTNRTKKPPLYT